MKALETPIQSVAQFQIQRIRSASAFDSEDALAVEEPLEIRLGYSLDGKRVSRSVSITMRTPGDDLDLAAGFLFTESIIQCREQIASIRHCGRPVGELKLQNVVRVELTPEVEIDLGRLQRHFYTSSSCGVCGKTSLEALELVGDPAPLNDLLRVPVEIIHRLPTALRAAQSVFDRTGGLHAAAIFDVDANLLLLREDVGRHNALDKLIGAQLREGRLPVADRLLLLSGRASFELIQKSLVARIPLIAAVGAPSSLAVELARRYNITLLGFVRDDRFNIYSAPTRIAI
jgi:FdhD protein